MSALRHLARDRVSDAAAVPCVRPRWTVAAKPCRAAAWQPDGGGDRTEGVGAAAGAHALRAAGTETHSGAGRARAKLAGDQHHRRAVEARRSGGRAQEAMAHRTVHGTVGACAGMERCAVTT